MGTTKTVKPELEHKDKLGRIIKVGDTVCYPSHNSLEFGTVKKLNNKMVKMIDLNDEVVDKEYCSFCGICSEYARFESFEECIICDRCLYDRKFKRVEDE